MKVTSFETVDNFTRVVLDNTNLSTVNLLRAAILSEVPTWAIDIVIFDQNISAREDELLAFRLGQLVIDNDDFIPDSDKEHMVYVKWKGPMHVTTDDLVGLPFRKKTPIISLREGDIISMTCIVKKDVGNTHPKWKSVSVVSFDENDSDDSFTLTFEDIGMLSPKAIFENALLHMEVAANREAPNIFFTPVLPK